MLGVDDTSGNPRAEGQGGKDRGRGHALVVTVVVTIIVAVVVSR